MTKEENTKLSVLDSLYNGYNAELNKNDLTNKHVLSQNSIKQVHQEPRESFVISSTKATKSDQTSDPFTPQSFTAFEAACRSDG